MVFSEPRFGPSVLVVTVDLCGVAGHARTRLGGDGCARCRSWSHGLLAGEHADENQPALTTVRTDQRLDWRDCLRVGLIEWWDNEILRRLDLGWGLKLQHLPYPGGVVALRRMP